MSTDTRLKNILLAQAPRKVAKIFSDDHLARLQALGKLTVYESAPFADDLFNEIAPDLQMILGQIDLSESRLRKAGALKAIFNVEGNFLPNIDYEYCPVIEFGYSISARLFAEPVAETALGMAIDLARA